MVELPALPSSLSIKLKEEFEKIPTARDLGTPISIIGFAKIPVVALVGERDIRYFLLREKEYELAKWCFFWNPTMSTQEKKLVDFFQKQMSLTEQSIKPLDHETKQTPLDEIAYTNNPNLVIVGRGLCAFAVPSLSPNREWDMVTNIDILNRLGLYP